MSIDLLIAGGTVVDPKSGRCGPADVLIRGGRVEAVDVGITAPGVRELDASGLVVAPGFIDLHVHLREPGEEWKETIASGARAAAAGGFCAVCCMANTHPPIDDAARVAFVRERARAADGARVFPVGAVSKGLAGEELAELGGMFAAGAVAASDDGRPVMNAELMRCALEYAKMLGRPIISHAEDLNLAAGGAMNLGEYSTRLGLRGMPAAAEEAMVARDIMLAAMTGGHVHIAHASTAGTVAMVRDAKRRGIRVTAEATPHHLTLTDRLVWETSYDTDTKMNPPLRTPADVAALREGLRDGTIDCIATDHAPHHRDDKEKEYAYAAFGISGLETAVPLVFTELVEPGEIDLLRAIAALTVGPAAVVGLELGGIVVGGVADITLIDPELELEVRPQDFVSLGKNTPFSGRRLRGWPVVTIVNGRVAFDRAAGSTGLDRAGGAGSGRLAGAAGR